MRTHSFGIFFRTLSAVLALAILLVFMPESVLAEVGEAINSDPTPETVSEEELQSADLACVVGEVDWRRSYNTKTFRLSDGSFTLADYSHQVHFKDESGAWADYDNTLSHVEKGYRNTASNVYYTFSETCSDGFLLIQSGLYQIRFTLRDANLSEIDVGTAREVTEGESGKRDISAAVQLPRYSSELYYREIAPDTDLRYILQGSDLKEMIVLNARTEVRSYSFDLTLDHLILEMTEDGSILLTDPDSQGTQFVIPPAFMEDAKGNRSEQVSYTLSAAETGYTLTITPDREWICADDRAFPVVIDPTLEKYQTQYSGGRIKDTYIKVGENSVHGGWAYMNVGTNNGYENVALIGMADSLSPEYPALPAIPKTATVTSAKLLLRTLDSSGTGVTVGVHQVEEDWNPGTAQGTVPSYDDTVLDYVAVNAAGSEYVLDVTKPVIAWYGDATDTLRSYGFALTALSGSGHVSFSTVNNSYYHDQYPMFLISYRDTKGLEGHWQFLSYGAGNAGAGHVNLFNGNLVFINDEISSKGNLLPVTVSHVFNSSIAGEDFTAGTSSITSDFSNMKVGKGWKLSVQETVNRVTLDGDYWYVYSDSDGTELYFLPDTVNGLHMSEDGYPLYLQVNTSGTYKYHLTDDYGNTKYFDWSGRLARMTDAFGNARNFAYTNNRLTSVSLTPAGGTAVTQLQFEYNNAGALRKITTPLDPTETVEFYYSPTYNGTGSVLASGYLREIVSSKSGSCTFEYNEDGTLAKTKDLDTAYETLYGYALFDGTNRISAVSEKSGSETGQTVGLSFENRTTVVRSSGLNDQYGDSDDLLTTYLTDTYGRVVCSYTSALNPETVYGAACAKYTPFTEGDKRNNKITADAVKGKTVENLLLNHNCESTGNWTGASSGSGYSGSLSSSEKLYGSNSFRLYSSSSATGYYRRYQNVTVPETGTYTFSAYVKTSGVSTGTNAGAYLILGGTESERVTGTTNTAIQNGWRRISVTKTLAANTTVTVQIRLANASGTAYFDCLQLEKGEVPSDYNLLQNGGMTLSSGGWLSSPAFVTADGRRSIRLSGDPTALKYNYQTVALNVPQNTTLVLSGWGKAESVSTCEGGTSGNRTFRVVASLMYADGTWQEYRADFNPYLDGWQYSSAVIVPEQDVTSATVFVRYDHNCNDAYFDDISLTVEPVQTYAYDANGNLTSTKNENGNESLLNYAANGVDLAKFTDVIGSKYCYTYKTVNSVSTHAVETVSKTNSTETTTYQTLTYGYDAYGNAVSSTLSSPTVTGVVSSAASYIESGNFLSSVTDSLGGITAYGYDSAKLLKYVENANSRRTGYLYDSRNRNTAVFLDLDEDGIPDSNEANVQYSYTNNRLTGIETDATSYTLSYDSFGNLSQVKAGNNTLASYMYSIGNGKLQRLTYGNGDYEDYVYDHLDRLVSVKVNGTVTYTLTYDANGFPAKCADSKAGITHTYEYDGLGRLIRAWQTDTATGVRTLGVENVYDSYGRADKSTYVNGNRTLSYDLTYKTDSNLVSSISMPTPGFGSSIGYTYDGLDRLTRKTVSFQSMHSISEEYNYYGYSIGGVQYTTPLVSELALKKDGAAAITYSYTYDSLGNVLTVSENGVMTFSYEYDESNQLKRADDVGNGIIYLYDYDLSGSITAEHSFPYYPGVPTATLYAWIGDPGSSSSINYAYSSGAWGDLLTNYNGTTISYDAIGNPTNWKNSTIDVHYMVWEGRKLTALTKDMLFHTLSFEYNADGVRTQKSNVDYVEGQYLSELHDYIVDGTKIVKETITKTVGSSPSTTATLYYYYDANGSVAGFEYNGTPYYYQKNLQGDIVRICDLGGGTVAQYTYGAWGEIRSITGSQASTVGQINPFRYRGYYYDTETGFYYLQTRYYDPEIHRFISSDRNDVLTTSIGALTDKNLFAYCDNNPVMRTDSGGNFWHIIAGAAIGGLIGGISSVIGQVVSGNGINWGEVGVSAAAGALSGAITAACPAMGAVATGFVQGAIGAASHVATELVNGRTPTVVGTLAAGVISGVLAGGAKAIGNALSSGKLEIGRIKGARASKGFPGVRYKTKAGPAFSIELHGSHNNHTPHIQVNKWLYQYKGYEGKPYRFRSWHFEPLKPWKGIF